MSAEENKALVRRFVEEFWNEGKTTAADELMTSMRGPQTVEVDPEAKPSPVRGAKRSQTATLPYG